MPATVDDANVILKLFELRREAEMRKARNWWLTTFWPSTFDDVNKISSAMGTQENAWFRQVTGYWEMAASFVNHGAVNAELFLEPSFSNEMFFLFAKVKPMLSEIRSKMSPTYFANVEKVINSTEKSREQLARMEKNVEARRKAMAAKG